jgi:hypothetical protein
MISGRAHLKGSASTGAEGRKKTGTTDDKKKEKPSEIFSDDVSATWVWPRASQHG